MSNTRLHIADIGEAIGPTVSGRTAVGPKRQELAFGQAILFADGVTLVASFLVSFLIRDRYLTEYGGLNPFSTYLWLLPMIVPTWLVIAKANGLTLIQPYQSKQRFLWLTLKTHAIGALLLLSALFLMRAVDVSRLLIQIFLAVSLVGLSVERLVIARMLERRTRAAQLRGHRLLVVGVNAAGARLHQRLTQSPHWGVNIAGFVSTMHSQAEQVFCDKPVLGGINDVAALLDSMVFDEVVMADSRLDQREIDSLVDVCLPRGVTFSKLVRMPSADGARHHAEALGDGLYFMALETTSRDPFQLAIKRLIDIGGACLGLGFCAIVFVVAAPLIVLTSPGPIIFRQSRVGMNGRRFTLYKFRTMCDDAEQRKVALQALNEAQGPLFKIERDPRITGIGKLLRRAYIDELPQFWNVLTGDLSLVGTRPPTPDEVACYSARHRRRLSVRPGITGLWQCQGHATVTDFEHVVRLDCAYIDGWTLWLDLKILMRTCLTVVRLAGR